VPSSRSSLQALDGNARRHGWRAEVLSRVRRHFWLKTIGISAFMSLFFFAYFQVLRHPVGPVFVMPLTALDRAIDLQPSWLAAYLTLWVYVGIPPGLLLRLRTLVVYGCWIGALCLCALVIFYFWPTAVAPPEVTVDLARHPAFALLQGVDAAGNACPSLHVATAVFSAVWLHRALPKLGAPPALVVVNWLWCAAIVYSTVAIGQHVVLDVVGGIALALAFAGPASRWLNVDDHRS
jgi:membrane-associated phospholipid phosphatase